MHQFQLGLWIETAQTVWLGIEPGAAGLLTYVDESTELWQLPCVYIFWWLDCFGTWAADCRFNVRLFAEFRTSEWTLQDWRLGCDFDTPLLQTTKEMSFDVCMTTCYVTPNCSNYSYNNKTGICKLKSGLVHKADARDSNETELISGIVPINWINRDWSFRDLCNKTFLS